MRYESASPSFVAADGKARCCVAAAERPSIGVNTLLAIDIEISIKSNQWVGSSGRRVHVSSPLLR